MEQFNPDLLKELYTPPKDSHKGQNGKLLIIGGSHLFHSASLWSLNIASKIVDMVFYSSVPENNEIVQKAKEEFMDGIVIQRDQIEDYIHEADCILIGPGMVRTDEPLEIKADNKILNLKEINDFEDEGIQTYYLTKYLLHKYPQKKWVIDAGALQMMEPEWLLQLNGKVILIPHLGEFERIESRIKSPHIVKTLRGQQELRNKLEMKSIDEKIAIFSQKFNCIVMLKGEKDIICSDEKCIEVAGGNAGMTKGGTGDVLAGLVAALACKNELFLAAASGSYFNKKAGESLFEKVGYYFNASDLVQEIPKVMNRELLHS